MSVHRLKRQQQINAPLQEVWEFFSQAANLATITPDYMDFRVTSEGIPDKITAGQIIEYKVSPIGGISLYWMTEITHVVEGKLFVDEQRKGPYKMWHHQHHFEEHDNSTLMSDIVHYELPLWVLGDLLHSFFIKKQLENIFEYRQQKINELFNT